MLRANGAPCQRGPEPGEGMRLQKVPRDHKRDVFRIYARKLVERHARHGEELVLLEPVLGDAIEQLAHARRPRGALQALAQRRPAVDEPRLFHDIEVPTLSAKHFDFASEIEPARKRARGLASALCHHALLTSVLAEQRAYKIGFAEFGLSQDKRMRNVCRRRQFFTRLAS